MLSFGPNHLNAVFGWDADVPDPRVPGAQLGIDKFRFSRNCGNTQNRITPQDLRGIGPGGRAGAPPGSKADVPEVLVEGEDDPAIRFALFRAVRFLRPGQSARAQTRS